MKELMFWLIVLVILVGVEIATMGLTTIWFAGGAFIAVIAAALGAPVYIQITLFLAVSVVLLLFTRPLAMKYFNNGRIRTNAESLVGKSAVVSAGINNLRAEGQVIVDGQEWSARSTMDEVCIPEGNVVVICGISGVKLIVEERQEEMRGPKQSGYGPQHTGGPEDGTGSNMED